MCVCERERERACVCVCERERKRKRKRESVCVYGPVEEEAHLRGPDQDVHLVEGLCVCV